MQYLITARWVKGGPQLSPEKVVPLREQTLVPSLEMLAEWEEEGRIYGGGVYPGERAGTWVIEADSSEELGRLVSSLPFWNQMKWHVRPLQSTRSAVKRERRVRERVRERVSTSPGASPEETAAQTERQPPPQKVGLSSGNFLGQKMDARFSYLILACVLWLAVVWAALTAYGSFEGSNLLLGIFALFVSFNLGAFLFAFRARSWYIALARSTFIALLGYGVWVLLLAFFSPFFSVGEVWRNPAATGLDTLMIGVSAAAIGLATAAVDRLRLTTEAKLFLLLVISLIVTGIQFFVWILVWGG